jgi:hypothetical protein
VGFYNIKFRNNTRYYVIQLAKLVTIISACNIQADPIRLDCNSEFSPARGDHPFVDAESIRYLVPEGSKIGSIYYTQLDIFDEADPRENNWLYRWANRFHLETRADVIEAQILFREDDNYDERMILESARLLRKRKYLYDAAIRPVSQCGKVVDLEVISRDIWSFTPEVSFKRSGGENTYRFSIRETNAFGTGQEISLGVKKDLDRRSNEFTYKNNNLMGSRIAGRMQFTDSDDGSEQFVFVQLPFYALDSRRAWGLRLRNFERDDRQFFRADDVTEVAHESQDYMVTFGMSAGLVNGLTRRWTYGYRFRDDSFEPGDELPPPTEFPIDKRLSYPFLRYTSVVDDYTTASNLEQIQRIEDLHLGHTFSSSIGYASSELGSDQDRIVLDGYYEDVIHYDGDILWRHNLAWSGLWNLDSQEPEDIIINYHMRYFHNQTKHRTFFVSFNAVYTKNLNTNQQVVFGGDTGVRAFENRLQVGDRRIVLTLEERFYSDIHLFNLVRVGWAIFVDAGRAYKPDVDQGFEDDYLANIGFGLRLASTKVDAGSVIHIDIAFPLSNRDDPDVNSSQLSLSIKNEF